MFDATVVWETHLVTWKPPAIVDSTKDKRVSAALARHEPLVMGGHCDLAETGENYTLLTKGETLGHNQRAGVSSFCSTSD